MGFICLHIGAAAYHYFIKHDGIAARMVPGRLGRRRADETA
jgi:cytochrome b561